MRPLDMHKLTGWLATAMLAMSPTVTGCTKRNPDICCDSVNECTLAGLDAKNGLAHCAEGVCVNYACVSSGCDDDGDCHDPKHPMCVSGQCYGPAEACRDRGGAQVVFLSTRSGVSQVYSSYADGTGVNRIIKDEVQGLYSAQPSPDGTQVAYVRLGSIFTISSDGTQQKQLTSDGLSVNVHWSPDGTRLAVDPLLTSTATAYVMSRDGTQRHEFKVPSYMTRSPIWSPDSAQVAFLTQNDPLMAGELWLASSDGTNLKQLTEGFVPQTPPGFDPTWNPDGAAIVLLSPNNSFGDLRNVMYIKPVDGSNASVFGPNDFPAWDPAWSHDGTRLAYIRSNASNATSEDDVLGSDVVILNRMGQITHTLGAPGHAKHPRWSPDDQYILFQDKTPQGDLEVYRANSDGTNLVNLSMSPSDDFGAEWTSCPQ